MEICCLPFNFFSCCNTVSKKSEKKIETIEKKPLTVDEERAINALSILKLEQIQGAQEHEAPGFSVVSVIKTFKDSLENATPEEVQQRLRGLKELFWHIGIALSELHTHEAGAADVYEKTVNDSLDFIEAKAKIVAENLSDPRLSAFVNDAIKPEELMQMAHFYVALNNQKEIHGAVTVGDLRPENIYVEFDPKGFARLTLINTGSLANSLNAQGEGTGFAFNDVIHMVHSTIEYCAKQGLKFEDLGGILEDFIKGYQLAFKIRLQDRIIQQKLNEDEIQMTARSYMPTLLYPLMSLKVMIDIIARNLSELLGMSPDDPEYEVKAKIVRNTTHTIDCETSLFRKILQNEISRSEKEEAEENTQEVAEK